MINTKRAFREKEAAEYLSVSVSLLQKGRSEGRHVGNIALPPYIKAGKSVLYLKEDLDSWLESLPKIQNTSQIVNEEVLR